MKKQYEKQKTYYEKNISLDLIRQKLRENETDEDKSRAFRELMSISKANQTNYLLFETGKLTEHRNQHQRSSLQQARRYPHRSSS